MCCDRRPPHAGKLEQFIRGADLSGGDLTFLQVDDKDDSDSLQHPGYKLIESTEANLQLIEEHCQHSHRVVINVGRDGTCGSSADPGCRALPNGTKTSSQFMEVKPQYQR